MEEVRDGEETDSRDIVGSSRVRVQEMFSTALHPERRAAKG